ncbi:MAG TPA: glycosyltransferase family 2 protein [Mucilaginibacter sp.]|nr:glycosyltransferase family 2 protein [Mucilaginibacter sp.]
MADITIIIPTYNRLWCLPAAIESCRDNQCSVEIIVVDDGSTDGTWDWLQQQSGIVALHQANCGKCPAVNRAFAQAGGKYVRFLDSDDEVAPGANDAQFELAEANSADIVVSGYRLVDENHQLLREQPWTMCDDFIAQQLGECDSSHYSAYLFKRSFINDIPHRPEYAFRDDRLFVLEAALKHPKVVVHEGLALMHTEHKLERLQVSEGQKQMVQNTQHLNIYKTIFAQLKKNGGLTMRRIKAAEKILWPLCHWIAKTDINEAAEVFNWIKTFDPDFKIPEGGALGKLYNKIGFKATERLLRLRRLVKYG